MRGRPVRLLTTLAVMAVVLATAVPARAVDPAQYRQMVAQQKQQQESYIKRLELLPGKHQFSDLLQIESDGGRGLRVRSPLLDGETAGKPTNQQVRTQVEGFEGDCVVLLQPLTRTAFYMS